MEAGDASLRAPDRLSGCSGGDGHSLIVLFHYDSLGAALPGGRLPTYLCHSAYSQGQPATRSPPWWMQISSVVASGHPRPHPTRDGPMSLYDETNCSRVQASRQRVPLECQPDRRNPQQSTVGQSCPLVLERARMNTTAPGVPSALLGQPTGAASRGRHCPTGRPGSLVSACPGVAETWERAAGDCGGPFFER